MRDLPAGRYVVESVDLDAQQARQYDVAPDGRFLVNTVIESAAAPITLIQNWQSEAKQ